jgi:transposase
MLRPDLQTHLYLYVYPVDMRKSIDGLSRLVEREMALTPMTDALFAFCNRSRDKVKMLCWERNGFIFWYRRLKKQRFRWPKTGETLPLSGQELNWLLDGFDISIISRIKPSISTRFASVHWYNPREERGS